MRGWDTNKALDLDSRTFIVRKLSLQRRQWDLELNVQKIVSPPSLSSHRADPS